MNRAAANANWTNKPKMSKYNSKTYFVFFLYAWLVFVNCFDKIKEENACLFSQLLVRNK